MREDWDLVSLGELYGVGSSKRVLKSQWQSSGVPFYRGREITRLAKTGEVDNSLFISEALFSEYSEKYGVPIKDDIVITAIGTIGNSYIVKAHDRFYFKDASVLWLSKTTNVNSQFINLWLASPLMKKQLDEGNGATVDTLTIKKLKGLTVKLPTLPEQKRIVAILDEAFEAIDAAIANTQKNLANARELFESYLNDVFKIETASSTKKLSDICTSSSGGTPSKKNIEYWSGDIPWASGRDMKSTELTDTTLHVSQSAIDESSTRMASAGTLLVLVRGMGLAHGAQIAEVLVPCAFNQDIRSIKPIKGIGSRYLLYALRTRINLSDHVLSSAAHGTLKIDMPGLMDLLLPVPTLQKQITISKKIDALSNVSKELEFIYSKKLKSLNDLKQSLLAKAFSGELTAQSEEDVKEAVG